MPGLEVALGVGDTGARCPTAHCMYNVAFSKTFDIQNVP